MEVYWIWILFGVAVVSKVLNTITKHFSEYKGLVKWSCFLIDLLDIIKTTPPPKFVKKNGKTTLNK